MTHRQSSGFKKPAEREENVEKSRKKTRFVQQSNELGSKEDVSFLTLWTRSFNMIKGMSRHLNTPPSYEITISATVQLLWS